MNLLLDTPVALWAITDSPRLSDKARELILSPRARIWISAASIWEIAIKHSLGRGDMPISGKGAMAHFRAAGYQFLPVEPEHAAAIEGLPKHHQDPFDRLLATQAQVEPMRLLSHDPMLVHYGDFVVPGMKPPCSTPKPNAASIPAATSSSARCPTPNPRSNRSPSSSSTSSWTTWMPRPRRWAASAASSPGTMPGSAGAS